MSGIWCLAYYMKLEIGMLLAIPKWLTLSFFQMCRHAIRPETLNVYVTKMFKWENYHWCSKSFHTIFAVLIFILFQNNPSFHPCCHCDDSFIQILITISYLSRNSWQHTFKETCPSRENMWIGIRIKVARYFIRIHHRKVFDGYLVLSDIYQNHGINWSVTDRVTVRANWICFTYVNIYLKTN